MADDLAPHAADGLQLRFACSCASAVPVASDPWAAVAMQRKLPDGTKERILNAIYRRPHTITQLAQAIGLSAPSVHRHVAELLASELVREVPVGPAERRSPVERYYRPAFPVVLAADRRELQPVLAELAETLAGAFRARRADLEEAFARAGLPDRGEPFEALLHYLYAAAARLARERLEAEGILPPWPAHGDGSRWVWWAEERPETEAG